MGRTLNARQLADFVGDSFLSPDGRKTKEIGGIEIVSGDLLIDASGKTNGYIRVTLRDEMLNVQLLPSNDPLLGLAFDIFVDDATEERVERYLNHYRTEHKHHLAMVAEDAARLSENRAKASRNRTKA